MTKHIWFFSCESTKAIRLHLPMSNVRDLMQNEYDGSVAWSECMERVDNVILAELRTTM
jgi:hypothetical protein